MAKNGAVNIKIVYNIDGKSLKDGATDIAQFREQIEATVRSAQGLNANAINFASICAGVESVNQSVGQLQGILKGLSDAYAAQEQAEVKLTTVMRQRMMATEGEIQAIKDLASAQQKLGVIGDEVQLAGAQQLATFLNTKDALARLIPAMNDLVAQQRGLEASTSDAVSAGNLMGKVMQGQTSALKRMGITFTAAQEQVMKYGTEMERASMLAEVITQNVGHMNAELAKTDAGKLKQLENTMGDWKETLGKKVQAVLPFVTIVAGATTALTGVVKLTAGVKAATVAIKGWNITAKLSAVTNRLFSASATSAAAAQQGLNASLNAGTVAANRFRIASNSARMSMLLWAGALGAATYGATKFRKAVSGVKWKSEEAREEFDELTNATLRAEQAALSNRAALRSAKDAYASAQTEIEKYKKKIEDCNGKKQEEKKLLEELQVTFGEAFGSYKTLAEWYGVLTTKGDNYCQTLMRMAEIEEKRERIRTLKDENKRLKEQIDNGELSDEFASEAQPSYKKPWWEYFLGYSPTMDTKGNISTYVTPTDSPLTKAKNAIAANDEELNRLYREINEDKGVSPDKRIVFGPNNAPDKKIDILKDFALETRDAYNDVIKNLEAQLGTASESEYRELLQRLKRVKSARDAKFPSDSGSTPSTHDLRAEAEAIDISEVMSRNLQSLADYDQALSDLQKKQKYAIGKDAYDYVTACIKAIEAQRKAFQGLAEAADEIDVAEVVGRNLQSLEDYDQAIDDLEKAQRRAITREAYDAIGECLEEIKRKRAEAFGLGTAEAGVPAPIEQLNTQKELNGALDYYRRLQQTQSMEEAMLTQKTIDALQEKLDAYQRAIDLAREQAEVARMLDLGKAELTVEIKSMGLGELESRIRNLRAALADTKNPLSDDQREAVQGMVDVYESWRGKLVDVGGELARGWEGIKSVKSAVESVTEAFKGGHTVFEKIVAVVDGVIAGYQAINAITAVCQAISLALGAAKGGEAATFAALSAVEAAAAKEEASAFTQLAAAKIFAANAALGIGGLIKGTGEVAGMLAVVKGAGAATAFAEGGLISGPTLALMGEYPTASRDPEVVAPLSKLRGMLDEGGGSIPKTITLRAKGGDLVATLDFQRNKLIRIG